MGVKRLCSVEGCGGPHHARGMCKLHYMRWWHSQNQHRSRDYWHKYWLAHPEKVREAIGKYNLAHPGRKNERSRKWRIANPERQQENSIRWKKAHPENVRAARARRRNRKTNAVSNLTPQEAAAILAQGCFFSHLQDCQGELCVAHDIPIIRGGNTTEANVFCLCRRHNLQMGTKTLAEMFGQLGLL